MSKKIDFGLLNKVGKPKDLVDNLLNSQIERVDSELGSQYRGIGNKILSMFVQNGNRNQLDAATIAERIDHKIDEDTICQLLDRLTEAGLLRFAGNNQYEIINNLMAQRAFQKVEGENLLLRKMEAMVRDRIERNILLDEDDLKYIENSINLLELNPSERQYIEDSRRSIYRKKRRLWILIITAFLLLSTLSTVTFFSEQRARRSNRLYQQANRDLKVSNNQLKQYTAELKAARDSLEIQRDSALMAKGQAEQAAIDARIAEQMEFRARLDAETAEQKARLAAIEAERQAALAIASEQRAEEAAEEARQRQIEAEESRRLADLARARAQALNQIVISHNVATRALQLEDSRLKALIALQAYRINTDLPEYGDEYHPSIVKVLYNAAKDLENDLQYNISNAHRGTIRDIVAHPTLDIFYTTGSDGTVLEWEVTNWNRIGKPEVEIRRYISVDGGSVHNALALNGDASQLMVVGELPIIQLVSTESRQLIEIIPVNTRSELFGGGFLADNQSLITFGMDTTFLMDVATDTLAPFSKFSSKVNDVYSVNDSVFALSFLGIQQDNGYEFQIQKFFDGTFTTDELFLPNDEFKAITAVSVGRADTAEYVAFGFEDGRVLIFPWEVNTLSPVGERSVFGQHDAPISDIAFSNSGKYLSFASYDGTVSVWEIERLSDPSYLPMVFDLHDGWALSVAFSRDDRFLLVGDRNGSLNFWSLRPEDYAQRICQDLLKQSRNPLDLRIRQEVWQRFFGSAILQKNLCR